MASVALVVWLAYHPVYTMLYRDAVVTTWLNVVAAPIAGTIEDFDLRPGERVALSGEVGRIVNYSVDRSGVIRAEAAARRAAVRLTELNAYESRIGHVQGVAGTQDPVCRWLSPRPRPQDRGVREPRRPVAGEGRFRRRLGQAQADVAAGRQHLAGRRGSCSLHPSRAAGDPQRCHEGPAEAASPRELAGQGVYLQEDGKEPEWSWRSLDELRLEMQRTERTARETTEEVATLQAALENERKNLGAATSDFQGPRRHDDLVDRGKHRHLGHARPAALHLDRLSRLLVDVPVIDTLAVLVDQGSRAEVLLEGEDKVHPGAVVMSRGSSSRLGKAELASITEWRKSAAQVIVELQDPGSVAGCPIGRRVFVRFPRPHIDEVPARLSAM